MRFATLLCTVFLAVTATHAAAQAPSTGEVAKELAPNGALRVAIAMGPSPSAFWSNRDPATGAPRGVTVDLANALARKLGVPLQLVPYPSSGALIDAIAAGAWDVTFVPADVERARLLDFTAPYYLYEIIYLVRAGSPVRAVSQIDRPGVRIAAIANSTTLHHAARALTKATLVPLATEGELFEEIRAGRVDAVAVGRRAAGVFAPKLPGSRILNGGRDTAGIAAAVPKNHPVALAYLRDFIEEAKASGAVQKALDAAGVKAGVIAPPAISR